jgi:hypothetical protein
MRCLYIIDEEVKKKRYDLPNFNLILNTQFLIRILFYRVCFFFTYEKLGMISSIFDAI